MHLISYLSFAFAFQCVQVFAGPPDESGTIPNGTQQFTWSPDLPNSDNCGSGIDNLILYPYDVYYNGTASFWYTPQLATDTCAKNYTSIPAVFSIGAINVPAANLTRSNWDNNNFFFSLSINSAAADPNCNQNETRNGTCEDTFAFQSSSPGLYFSQGWTASATKAADGYDFSGSITTTKVNFDNNYAFFMPQCPRYPGGAAITAGQSIDELVLSKQDGVTITGHASATNASATVVVGHRFDRGYLNATLTISFTGSWFNKGASLDTSGSVPATVGKATITPGSAPSAPGNEITKYMKYIIPAVVALVIVLLMVWCGRSVVRGRKVRRGAFEPYSQQGYPMQPPPTYQGKNQVGVGVYPQPGYGYEARR